MITKNFSTQTIETSACWFRRDYSYRTNPNTCLECEFCYKYATGDPERRRSSSYIDTNEKFHSKTIFKTPVVISRFCEPFVDGAGCEASINVAEKCLANNCQFIIKTALSVPEKLVNIMSDNKDKAYCQLRFVGSDSVIGMFVTNELAPKFLKPSDQLEQCSKMVKLGINTAALIDPFIIGVNDINSRDLVKQIAATGVKKLIVKQLFSTDRFLQFLKLRVDRKYTSLLCDNTSGYWTYDSYKFLYYLYPVLEECEKYGIKLSTCSNRTINELICGDSNCCQLENPMGYYDKNGNIINE
jgi:DNA repair photolyase